MLKCLSSIFQTERHLDELEEAKGCCNGCLRDMLGIHRDLVVRSYQIDLGKDGACNHGDFRQNPAGVKLGNSWEWWLRSGLGSLHMVASRKGLSFAPCEEAKPMG